MSEELPDIEDVPFVNREDVPEEGKIYEMEDLKRMQHDYFCKYMYERYVADPKGWVFDETLRHGIKQWTREFPKLKTDQPNKKAILQAYMRLTVAGVLKENPAFQSKFRIIQGRTDHGIAQISTMMSPYPVIDAKKPSTFSSKKVVFAMCLLVLYFGIRFTGIVPLSNLNRVSVAIAYILVLISGIFAVADYTKTQQDDLKAKSFTCKSNCFYCPFQPNMPRSYRSKEDVTARGIETGFDPVKQMLIRAKQLLENGHVVDKLELSFKAGSYSDFSTSYRYWFTLMHFYAANMLEFCAKELMQTPVSGFDNLIAKYKKEWREPYADIKQEQLANEKAKHKIIGITIEDKPDLITKKGIKFMRLLAVTRVEVGIQHTNDAVLRLVNRGCLMKHAERACKLLHDAGFKVAIHIMLNLPYPADGKGYDRSSMYTSSKEDIEMLKDLFNNPKLRFHEVKLYPFEPDEFTEMYKWMVDGRYVAYSHEELIEVIKFAMANMPRWVRISRVLRNLIEKNDHTDEDVILIGRQTSGIRDTVARQMHKEKVICYDIRNCEIKGRDPSKLDLQLDTEEYDACGGTDRFLSFVTPDKQILAGFLRLRFSDNAGLGDYFPELVGAAMILELHIYGQTIATQRDKTHDTESATQNKGFGTQLLAEAERQAIEMGYDKISVISGNSVRDYYRRFGYEVEGENGYMTKRLDMASVAA